MKTIARYIFESTNDAELCMEQLWRQLAGGFSRGANEVYIESGCRDPELASKICQACGGNLGG